MQKKKKTTGWWVTGKSFQVQVLAQEQSSSFIAHAGQAGVLLSFARQPRGPHHATPHHCRWGHATESTH
jgi:hypothetical protein